MKRIVIVLLALLPALYAAAQVERSDFSIGPRVGLNFSKFTNTDNAQSRTGLLAGITSTYSINERTGLSFDLLYSQEGAETDVTPQVETQLDYLRFLPTFNLFFRDREDDFRPKIYIGPTLGILLDADAKTENTEEDVDIKDTFNTLDIGLALGLGFNYRIGGQTWLNLDGRFLPGLTNIIDNQPDNLDAVRNQSFQVSLGFAFGL